MNKLVNDDDTTTDTGRGRERERERDSGWKESLTGRHRAVDDCYDLLCK